MSYIVSWYIYVALEIFVRSLCLYGIEKPGAAAPALLSNNRTAFLEIIIFIISPGWSLADHYKNIIRIKNCRKSKKSKLAGYIINNNSINLLLSAVLLNLVLWCFDENRKEIGNFIASFVIIRHISRSFEITYAFGKDALAKSSSSALQKNDRLKLALNSYLEIFINSASAYFFYMQSCGTSFSAVLASLNIGTFVGAGSYTNSNGIIDMELFLPFLQIFSTSTLVIFSLAMYAGRKK